MNRSHIATTTLSTLIALALPLTVQAQHHLDEEHATDKVESRKHADTLLPQGQDKASDDHPVETLEGDQIPEGERGDSKDQQAPGGPHGDGRTDPGMLE